MLRLTLAAFACAIALPYANAAPDALTAGRRLAATCAACHGTDGATQGNALPPLAGQPKAALAASLAAYKAGAREATIMHQIARGYTDEQLDAIAAYFAAQPK